MKKTKHLISVGIVAARRLCTAVVECEIRRPERRYSSSLIGRLRNLGAGETVETVADKYIQEGNRYPRRYHLATFVKELRKCNKHHRALELMEWMEKRGIYLNCSDYAVKVDLLAKTQGIESAEKYFHGLSPDEQTKETCGALLNCYSREKMTGKAMTLFMMMDELNYIDTSIEYNHIMSLFMRLNQPEKVPPLVQQMKDRNISMDAFTYGILMNSYACLKDIDGVERVMEEVETKDSSKCDWTIYSHVASIYIKVGLFDKADLALKKLEEKIPPRDPKAYQFLISFYAHTKNLSEVHRVWNSLKSAFPKTDNLSYLVLLKALEKLDNLKGMKERYEEWLSGYSSYDRRITDVLVEVYLRHKMIKEADLLIEDAVKRGSGPSEATKYGSLFHRLLNPRAGESVAGFADKYFGEGRFQKKYELSRCLNELRRHHQHQTALELIEWMEKRGINFSYSDYAAKVDLLAKTKGIDYAEKYFNSLSPLEQNKLTYGTLLKIYCKEKMADKAVVLFMKMLEMNYVCNAVPFNNIMALSMKLNEPEKVPSLVKEMKERNISMDPFTYGVLMKSYARLKDIDGVERVMTEVETKHIDKCDWTIYSNVAPIYIDFHLFDKAELALKKLEERIPLRDREPYHFLISLYARIKNLAEVHRVWGSLKSAFVKTHNMSYLNILQALAKLDDFDGMKKYFEEWLSGYSKYDIRLTNVVVGVYLRQNMIKEAELLVEDAVKRGSGPNFWTHNLFVEHFLKTRQIGLALKSMETSFSMLEENRGKPCLKTTRAFFEYFEKEKDVNGAEEFCKILKKVNCLDAEAYKLLLSTYGAACRTEPEIHQRMRADGIAISTEVEDLLARVCPE